MIVYNITIKILPEIEQEWIAWQKEEHIPAVMASAMFNEYRFYKLLDTDEEDGITYIVQYFAPGRIQYEKYIKEFAPVLRDQAIARWGNRFIAFRTVMERVEGNNEIDD
jgi:hypothetical protein